MMFLIWSIILVLPTGLSAQTAQVGERSTVMIGARIDGRPFIWQDAVTKEYLGFFWDICTDAVTRAGYKFEAQQIDAATRKQFLETGEGIFDLLCDPTTITLSRIKEFIDLNNGKRLRFSPIVFVANGSYVLSAQHPSTAGGFGQFDERIVGCAEAIAGEKKSTAPEPPEESGFLQRLASRIPIQMLPPDNAPASVENKYEIWGYVDGTTSKGIVDRAIKRSADQVTICPRPLATHAEAAREFCAGRLARYYGDVEIVRAAIEEVPATGGTKCEADFKPTAGGSYEPYAFVVSGSRFRTLPEEFDHALYGMFSDGSIDRLFDGHFPDKRKSQFLNTLFRINSLPPGTPQEQP
ncbi:substrate-binding periplasmic protein [Roseovarius sp. Pro17]|uniref:substrate-binding periplasmic protein n=1 Tax=Roseovarius sp. Pro17 TaxID=3108175 RepID=UPI002D794A18|nr:hypothetical protein [Roseovarius sp. Pro17]